MGNDSAFIVKLEEVDKNREGVGGKAANLGEMSKAGLPVPPGFVITTDAYEKFLSYNKLRERIESLLSDINVDDIASLKEKSADISNLILKGEMPGFIEQPVKDAYDELSIGKEVKELGGVALDLIKAGRTHCFVAVRSSATSEDLASASFAGQLETILSVQGNRELMDAVKRCWASLFTARVIFYRKNKGFGDFPSMGVVVQKMIDAEKAGVMFTVNPVTNDTSQIVIEAVWGYGEAIVSGLVIPDEYLLNKDDGRLLEKRIGRKLWMKRYDPVYGLKKDSVERDRIDAQVLGDREIEGLWELASKVDRHYGVPQDIEWCEEKGRLFLVQTRPVTTLGRPEAPEESRPEGEVLLKGLGASPGVASGPVRIINDLNEMGKIEQGDILVTKMTSPAMVPMMKRAAAIVTDAGGRTCHASIVSRELGIPCIVGTETATSKLREGQKVTVDAKSGQILEFTETPKTPLLLRPTEAGEQKGATASGAEPAEPEPEEHTPDSDKITATRIKVNLAFPDRAEEAAGRAEGVGLLRAEHMLTESRKHPVHLARTNPEELVQAIVNGVGRIAKAFFPKPVWYRTLDARTDEFRELEGGEEEPEEANPMLGWHGIRRSLEEPDVFRCEIEALRRLQQQGMNNIGIMLPFVISVEELRKAKSMIDFPIKLGIMVETPAAALDMESFCREGVDFVSIGSNDLTQLVLGVDRDNANISKLYSELHPAVIHLIKHVIKVCRKHGVETSICGEAGSNPEMARILVELGIDSISAEMDALEEIKNTAARTERRLLLDRSNNKEESAADF